MTAHDPDFLTEEEAARLWERAAQLQAEAALRRETPSDGIDADTDIGFAEGYAVTHLRSAAQEAGLAAEFVDAALADVRAERALPRPPKRRKLARWFFKTLLDTVIVRRVIKAQPQTVMTAIATVFPREPYRLALRDQQGDSLKDGFSVFEIQGLGSALPKGLAAEVSYSAVRQVFVSLRPIGETSSTCEVTLRCPIAWSHNIGLVQGLVATAIGGGLGFGAGTAAASVIGLAVPIDPLFAASMAVVGVLAGGALGRMGYRAFCAHGISKAERALEGLLAVVAVHAESGWAVAAAEAPSSTPTDE